MGLHQRRKGQSGEREVVALMRQHYSIDLRRRVRQDGGDDDLVGLPGWSIEVKRHRTATRATIDEWWRQCIRQTPPGHRSVLFYRLDRGRWRAMWAPLDPDMAAPVECDAYAFWELANRAWPPTPAPAAIVQPEPA